MRHFLNFIYKHAKIVIAIVLIITAFFAYQATKIGLNASYSAFIPWGEYSDPFQGGVEGQLPVLSSAPEDNSDFIVDTSVYRTELYASTTAPKIEEQVPDFPYSTNYLVLVKGENLFEPDNLNLLEQCIENLENTRELSQASSVLDFVTLEKKGTRLATVPMAANREDGWNEENAALLKQRIENDPVVSYYLVGGSKQSILFTFQVAEIGQAREAELSTLLDPLREAGLEVYINGGGVINNKVMEYLNKDLFTLVGLCLVVILIVYYLCFKSKRSVLLPMSVSVLGLIWTFGSMALLDIDITILNIVTPCMVITLGSAYSIQLLSNYYANFNLEPEKRLVATSRILTTILFACLTTVCGFLVLLISQTEGLREFGIAVSLGVGYCAILAITYLPATLHLLKNAKQKQVTRYTDGFIARFVKKLSAIVLKYWVVFLLLLVLIVVGFVFVKDKISIDSNYMSYFPESDPFGRESKIFASEMGGTNPFTITIRAPEGSEKYFLKAENLQKVFDYEQKIKQSPDILQSISFPSYVAFANELYSGEYGIPEQNGLLNMLSKLIIVMQKQTGADLDDILSADGNSLSLIIQHWDSKEQDLMSTSSCTRIEYILTENLDLLPVGTSVRIAGDPIVNVKFANRLLADQNLTTGMSILIVFVLLVLAFRSISKPIYALVPIGSGIMINYIFMYLMGIPFDMVTVSFSSIAIGCGIDDAIHFILKYKNLNKFGNKTGNQLLEETMVTTGKPIILTTLSVIAGLMMLSFASYTPIRYFGLLMSVTLFSCMLSTLIFMPPVMILASKIKGLFKKNKLSSDEIKKAGLEVLVEIDRVCKELNIDYYLAFGTLLGAVRHKGYIPWDDDVDIWLKRKDMDIIVENFNKICKPQFKLFYYEDENYPYPFPKVYNLNTSVEEKFFKNIPQLGVWVDLFNLDYVQENHEEEDKQLIHLQHIRWMNLWHQATFWKKINLLWGQLTLKDTRLSDFKNTPYKVHKEMNELLAKNEPSKAFRSPTTIPDMPKIMKAEWFDSTIDIEFEGYMLKAPVQTEEILKVLYGDYMKLPSKAQQKLDQHYRSSKYVDLTEKN